jgi:hypothetical protein
MSFWTTTKTALALVSIGILVTPVLRKLGYLPPDASSDAANDSETASDVQTPTAERVVSPPELSLPRNGADGFSRH